MNKIVLVRGLPGSGKSTFAKRIVNEINVGQYEYFVYHIETDMYWLRPDGTYDFNYKLLGEAHKWCFDVVKNDMISTEDYEHVISDMVEIIVISNTFTTLKEMQPYIDLAENSGYDLDVVRCTANYGSIHGVPEATIEKMKNRFEYYEGEYSYEDYARICGIEP